MRFAGTDRDLTISRHHCELRINPPAVRVLDLGSRHGTFVNGHPVDGSNSEREPEDGNVTNGDVITIGGSSFTVEIADCPDHPDAANDPGWKEGEVAKRDCPITCPSDGASPRARGHA
jgi:predicted component of type VI protein secretion system